MHEPLTRDQLRGIASVMDARAVSPPPIPDQFCHRVLFPEWSDLPLDPASSHGLAVVCFTEPSTELTGTSAIKAFAPLSSLLQIEPTEGEGCPLRIPHYQSS